MNFRLFTAVSFFLASSLAHSQTTASPESTKGQQVLASFAKVCTHEGFSRLLDLYEKTSLLHSDFHLPEVEINPKTSEASSGVFSARFSQGTITLKSGSLESRGQDACDVIATFSQKRAVSLLEVVIPHANAKTDLITDVSGTREKLMGATAVVAGSLIVAATGPTMIGLIGGSAVFTAGVIQFTRGVKADREIKLLNEVLNSNLQVSCGNGIVTLQGDRGAKLVSSFYSGWRVKHVQSGKIKELELNTSAHARRLFSGLASDCRNHQDAKRIQALLNSESARKNVALLLKEKDSDAVDFSRASVKAAR